MAPPSDREEMGGGFLAWLCGPIRQPSAAPLPALAGGLLSVAIMALAIACGALAASFVQQAAGPTVIEPSRDPWRITAWLAAMQIATVVLVWQAAILRGKQEGIGPAAVLALGTSRGGWRDLRFGLVAMAALLVPYNGAIYLVTPETLAADLKLFAEMMRDPVWPLLVLIVGLGAPLSEELLMRGLLLPALATSRLRFEGAAVVSALAWTLLHTGYSLAGLVEVFLIGVLFAWLVWRTGSLWVPIACHAIYNTLLILALKVFPLPV
jgi:hypothetical protein